VLSSPQPLALASDPLEPENTERAWVHRKRRSEESDLANATHNPQADEPRTERVLISVPMRVTFERQWQELTQTDDVSPLGVRFRLSRRVEPGSRLRIEMPLPKHLRTHSHEAQLYVVSAFVIQVSQDNRKWRVVAEFV
jgi:hypothetical protein